MKKNKEFNTPFTYNKSGIEMQHNGLQWVQETVKLETIPSESTVIDKNAINIINNFRYKFELKPIYQISNLRENSPAANSGLQKGDVVISINGAKAYKYSLQQINSLLKSEEDKWIAIEVERNSQILKFKFQLKDVL